MSAGDDDEVEAERRASFLVHVTFPAGVVSALPDGAWDVLRDVAEERQQQIDRHGWTPEHDDRHDLPAWSWLLARRVTDLSHPMAASVVDVRKSLLEVAAIAVAAIEAHDRELARSPLLTVPEDEQYVARHEAGMVAGGPKPRPYLDPALAREIGEKVDADEFVRVVTEGDRAGTCAVQLVCRGIDRAHDVTLICEQRAHAGAVHRAGPFRWRDGDTEPWVGKNDG